MESSTSVKVEITNRFTGRSILRFFSFPLQLFCQDVFLVRLLKPRIGKFIFALAFLFFQDARRLRQSTSGPALPHFVRQHRAKPDQPPALRGSTGKSHSGFRRLQSHNLIVPPPVKKVGARLLVPLVLQFFLPNTYA